MKRIWTKETAIAWVELVEDNIKPRGLKYCSAMAYLRRMHPCQQKANS